MTKLGAAGPDDDKKDDVKEIKDPKVFTVMQPTFVPIPVGSSPPPRRRSLLSTLLLCLLVAALTAGTIFTTQYFLTRPAMREWTDQPVVFSEPQFGALNSQMQKTTEKPSEESVEDEEAQITIKQTDDGTQMIVELPRGGEKAVDGAVTKEAPVPLFHLGVRPEGQRVVDSSSSASSSASSSSSEEEEERPRHPYEMEGPSPDSLNFRPPVPWQVMEERRRMQENEMRMWRMRRMQQMMAMAAFQQQRDNAFRFAMMQRQQWAQQQMAAQMMMAAQARRQAEWEEYWRRVAAYRMMQQQQPPAMQQQEQPRPFWTQMQQQPMQMPQQQQQQPPFWGQPQWQQTQPQWNEQQNQPPQQNEEKAQVPQSQPLFLFQQSPPAQQASSSSESSSPSSSSSSSEEQPVAHSFIFIRRFLPIPQDGQSSSSEETDKNIPLRPHDASAQQIVQQMKGDQPSPLPSAPLPGIHDRIFQHLQSIAQKMQDQRPSQSPVFVQREGGNYDQDAIYEKLQRKAMLMQNDAPATTEKKEVEDGDLLGDEGHDIRRGDAILTSNEVTVTTTENTTPTTEPVMIENIVNTQPPTDQMDHQDELTSEEKEKVAQLDSTEVKEAAALEASLEKEAKEEEEKKEKEKEEAEKTFRGVVADANKESSSEEDPVTIPPTTADPLSEFFRFFENEAVKLSEDEKEPERADQMEEQTERASHEVESTEDSIVEDKNVDNEPGVRVIQVPTPISSDTTDAPAIAA